MSGIIMDPYFIAKRGERYDRKNTESKRHFSIGGAICPDRGSAGSDRKAGRWIEKRAPGADFTRCYRFRQDLYDGQCNCPAQQADACLSAQQNARRPAL